MSSINHLNSDWDDYLGNLDAAYEKELSQLFFETNALKRIKWGLKDSGKFIIVGAKGTGKTAICEYLRDKSSQMHHLIWRVDEQRKFMNIHVTNLGEYPSEIQSVLLNVILTQMVNIVKENKSKFPAKAKQALKELDETFIPRLLNHFKNFLQGATVNTGPITWDFKRITSAETRTEFTEFDINHYVDALSPFFSENPLLILFDDIDDIFLGADKLQYPAFVEGLIRASRMINLLFKKKVHFLVFIKYGVYRAFFDRPREFDKVKNYILILKWDEEGLEKMLSKRISVKLGIKSEEEPWETWSHIFTPKDEASINTIRNYLFEMCPSGPRDIIDLCNRAIEKSCRLEITLDDLKMCESGFSDSKVTAIYQDYGYTYPDVHFLIKSCFSMKKPSFTPDELKNIIFYIKSEKHVSKDFIKYKYFRMANIDDLIRIFYTVGFIGYEMAGKGIKFVLDDPNGDNLRDAQHYVIHKVYWKALGIKEE